MADTIDKTTAWSDTDNGQQTNAGWEYVTNAYTGTLQTLLDQLNTLASTSL